MKPQFGKQTRHVAWCTAILVTAVIAALLLTACSRHVPTPVPPQAGGTQSTHVGKKIVFVNSYHEGYEWSDGIEVGLKKVLDGTGTEVKFVRLNTKLHPEEASCQNAGLQAKAEIESFGADIVIAADDNAQKYLVVPYLKGKDVPVVFCGVNWDASMYGYPTDNVTGMIEVELPGQLVEHLKIYAKGERVGYLTVDSETERKVVQIYNERFFGGQMKVYWVKTYEEFKAAFVNSQKEVDILFLGNNAGIDRWEEQEVTQFIRENTQVPTGTINSWLAGYSLMTLAKSAEEQGEWAAQTALQILDGIPVTDISPVENEKGELIVNLNIAEQLGVTFSPSILKNARAYEPEGGDKE